MISAIHIAERCYLEQPLAHFCAADQPRIFQRQLRESGLATAPAGSGTPKNEASRHAYLAGLQWSAGTGSGFFNRKPRTKGTLIA